MKIGELANAVGLNSASIRYYESVGLLKHSDRTMANYRVYGEEHMERLRFIVKGKQLGFSLDEIKDILLLHDQNHPTCVHVRSLLEEKVRQVDVMLRGLGEFREELVRLQNFAGDMVDCRPSGGRICSIIEGSKLKGAEAAIRL